MIPVAGGTPTKIGTPSGNYFAATAGKAVIVWDALSANGVGKIHTWTQGGTYASPVALNVAANGAAASPDGSYIIFEANSNTAATVADIVGAKIDGTGIATLASQVDVGPGNFSAFVNGCVPNFGFPNSTTALVTSCATNPGDAGVPNATVNSYAVASDGGAWTSTPIVATNALPVFSWDGDGGNGTSVFTATTLPTEQISPVTGGAPTPIDTKDVNKGDWTFVYVNRAGTAVMYNVAGALYTSPTTVPAPTAVQATGVNYIRAVSGDEQWLVYTTTWDKGGPPPASFGSDLFLTKTTAGFTPVQLGTGTTNALFGLDGPDQFTTDSSHVMWIRERRHRHRHRRLLRDGASERHAHEDRHRSVAELVGDRRQGGLPGQLPELFGDCGQGPRRRRPQGHRPVAEQPDADARAGRCRRAAVERSLLALHRADQRPHHLHVQPEQRDRHG